MESINEEIAEMSDAEAIQALEDLKVKLDYLSRGSDALMRSLTKQLEMDELAGLIREYHIVKEIKP